MGLDYYEKCLSLIRDNVDIWIHSLSPTEIEFIAASEHISIKECLQKLKNAGLQSLPGGGAEMLVDEIRKAISPKKTRSKAWLDLMDDAHSIGLKTTATMVYGFGSGVGFLLAILALASVRYRLRYSNIPPRLRGVGMAMILTGLLSMAFMAFSGIDL